jgi:hypothetical protein
MSGGRTTKELGMKNKTIVIALRAADALALSIVGRTILLSGMPGGFLWLR